MATLEGTACYINEHFASALTIMSCHNYICWHLTSVTSATSSQWNNSFGEVISYAHFHLRAVTEVVDLLIDFFNWVQKKVTCIVFINLLQLSLSICCSCLCQSAAVVFVNLLQLSYQCTAVVSFVSILSTYSCLCPSTYEIYCTCLCQSTAAVL